MPNISHALPVGTLLSNNGQTYRVVSTLGAGGFGITYLVESQVVQDGRVHSFFYAMKEHFLSRCCEREASTSKVVFSKPVADEVENSLRDFVAEAARLQKVGTKHDNIVKVRDIFTENNTAYYIMEFLQGDNLYNYVKSKGRLTPQETYQLMEPIIDAVGFLHANKMTHLDIKPQNIMLTPDPRGGQRPVLIDFGLSKHYDDNGTPTSTINTLGCSDGYSPIEQYAGITTFSPTADIYSLGATMAFCLSGHNPSKATEVDQTEIAQYAQGNGNVGMAVGRMMQPSRSQRPQSIAEVYNVLNSKPAPEPARPTPPPPPPVSPTPAKPRVVPAPKPSGSGGFKPWMAVLCIIGGLALIAGVLAFFLGGSKGPHNYDNDTISQYYDTDVSSGGTLPYPSALTDPGVPVAVTLQWRQSQDLDLYVVQPDGQVISWDQTTIDSTGAHFSQDAMSTTDRKEETAYWYYPMPGTYDVFVSSMNEPASTITSYVGILNDGEISTYTVKIDPTDPDNIQWRAFFKVASFTVGNVEIVPDEEGGDYSVEVVEPVADIPETTPAPRDETPASDGIPVTNANRNDGHFGTTVGDYARANNSEAYDAAAVRRANNAGPSAPLKFTLLWDSSNDLDLIVNMPSGSDYVYYGNTTESASGGRFGGDDTGGSGSAEYVTFSNPPSGLYDAFVRVRGSVPSAGIIVKLVAQNGSTTKVYTTRIKRTGTDMKDVRMCTFSASGSSSGSGSSSCGSSSSIPTTSATESSSSYSMGSLITDYISAHTTTAYDSDAVSRASGAPGSGPVKVVLLWNFSNDCDLIVNQADMTEISYSNREHSGYGAHHSGDNTGGSGWNRESIYWTSPGTGLYDVFVRVRGSVPSNAIVKVVVKNGSTTTTYATRIIKSSSGATDFRLVQFRYEGSGSSSSSGSGSSGSSAPITYTSGSTNSYSSGNMVSSYVQANTSTAYDSEAVSRANSLPGSGSLKVSLLWDFSNDLDLIVNTNTGTDIYYGNRQDSSTGAHHSGDNTGSSSRNSESIYWTNPGTGIYDVFVRTRGTINNKVVRVVVKKGSSTTVYTTRVNKTSDGYQDIRICQFNY